MEEDCEDELFTGHTGIAIQFTFDQFYKETKDQWRVPRYKGFKPKWRNIFQLKTTKRQLNSSGSCSDSFENAHRSDVREVKHDKSIGLTWSTVPDSRKEEEIARYDGKSVQPQTDHACSQGNQLGESASVLRAAGQVESEQESGQSFNPEVSVGENPVECVTSQNKCRLNMQNRWIDLTVDDPENVEQVTGATSQVKCHADDAAESDADKGWQSQSGVTGVRTRLNDCPPEPHGQEQKRLGKGKAMKKRDRLRKQKTHEISSQKKTRKRNNSTDIKKTGAKRTKLDVSHVSGVKQCQGSQDILVKDEHGHPLNDGFTGHAETKDNLLDAESKGKSVSINDHSGQFFGPKLHDEKISFSKSRYQSENRCKKRDTNEENRPRSISEVYNNHQQLKESSGKKKKSVIPASSQRHVGLSGESKRAGEKNKPGDNGTLSRTIPRFSEQTKRQQNKSTNSLDATTVAVKRTAKTTPRTERKRVCTVNPCKFSVLPVKLDEPGVKQKSQELQGEVLAPRSRLFGGLRSSFGKGSHVGGIWKSIVDEG